MPPHATYPYTGRLVVRLSQSVVDLIVQWAQTSSATALHTLEELIAQFPTLADLGLLLAQIPGQQSSAAIGDFTILEVQRLEDRARHSPFFPVHSLIGYFMLDLRSTPPSLDVNQLLIRLEATSGIDRAYRELELRDAGGWPVYPNDRYVSNQGYLRGGTSGPYAHTGINVYTAAVWGKVDGTGIGFVDLETEWNFGHEDIPQAVHPLYNQNRYNPSVYNYGDHGTAVLGVVMGMDNTKGVLGIAPGATFLGAVSRTKSASDEWDVVGAVLAALQTSGMQIGDVLLIEVETIDGRPLQGYPIEVLDHWFDAIRLAVGNGMVVIEAAGNGTIDNDGNDVARNLDRLSDEWPGAPVDRSLNRQDPKFLDSGAIMVSACASEVAPASKHRRLPFATYGSRIDCYAWGENVCTSGYGYLAGDPSDDDTWYTDSFDGTSAASAIIAGAAILVQEMAIQVGGTRLAPTQIRALFSDPSLGTKVVAATGSPPPEIGVMPDLELIAGKIGALPDIFVRDSVGDAGALPSAMVQQSPDIILRSTPSFNPDADYGDTSPLANALPLNDEVQVGVANYLYVRMKNRGGQAAAGAIATVYWSEASPLVAPVHWNLVGQTPPVNIPIGGGLTVAGPITWIPASGSLPASDHGCFVVVLDHPLDPAPPLLPANHPSGLNPTSWNDFLQYVGRNNNVAWRNFAVLHLLAEDAGFLEFLAVFFLRGAGDEPRVFALEVLQRVAANARVWWDVPPDLASRLRESARDQFEQYREVSGGVRLVLRPSRLVRIPKLRLEARREFRCVLHVGIPRESKLPGQTVVLRQLYQGREVGRITWIIGDEASGVG
jgi:hypothetical protein